MKKINFKKILDAEKVGAGRAEKNIVDNITIRKLEKSAQTLKTLMTLRAAH